MGKDSKIDWTDASWNPCTGCTKVSAGCLNCYAEREALKLKNRGMAKYARGFEFCFHPAVLNDPVHWKKAMLIFVDSMSDLFHEKMTDGDLVDVFTVMLKLAPWHIYQILTKRPARMLQFVDVVIPFFKRYMENLWMGVSCEDYENTWRVNALRRYSGHRFVSFEPLLGSIGDLSLEGIEWVIVGGESGRDFRPMKLDWVREIRDEALRVGAAFFYKQTAGVRPIHEPLLDGQTWQEYPKAMLDWSKGWQKTL